MDEIRSDPLQILTEKNKLTPFQKLFEDYDGEKPQSEALWDEVKPVGKEN